MMLCYDAMLLKHIASNLNKLQSHFPAINYIIGICPNANVFVRVPLYNIDTSNIVRTTQIIYIMEYCKRTEQCEMKRIEVATCVCGCGMCEMIGFGTSFAKPHFTITSQTNK
jgi:hypothetical protein